MAKFTDPKIQEYLLNGGKIRRFIETREITIHIATTGSFFEDNGNVFQLSLSDLTADDWEIAEPEYDWDKIIKDKILCQFWNELKEVDPPIIGYLTKKTAEGFCGKGWYCSWEHCKPFNPAEYNIAQNLRDYEV